MDPDVREERVQDGNIVMALMPARNEVTQMQVAGSWGQPQAAQVSRSASLGLLITDFFSALSQGRGWMHLQTGRDLGETQRR